MMKTRLLGAVFALAASVGAASAADLYRAPPVATPVAPVLLPAYLWTGGFVGVQAGYGWGEVSGRRGPNVDGWLAGVHAGFNWQMNMLVVGLDASWSWSDMSQRFADVNWTGDVRGRLGFAVDRMHFYGAAGVAFADMELNGRRFGGRNASNTHVGWTAGLGAEYAVTNNWILGVEWKYADYGSERYNLGAGGNGRADLTTNIVQLRASYKF